MIERLVIVAGVSNSGKTTLIRSWQSNALPALDRAIEIASLDGWRVLTVQQTRDQGFPTLDGRVVFECNLTGPFRRGQPYSEVRELRHVLSQARQISVVTLWIPPERLLRNCRINWIDRLRATTPWAPRRAVLELLRRFSRALSLPDSAPRLAHWAVLVAVAIGGRRGRDFWRLYRDVYRLPARVRECYRQWLAYCAELAPAPRHNLIVEYESVVRFSSREEWLSATADLA
jgi:hypothetical protein